jgi:hypothetical protein
VRHESIFREARTIAQHCINPCIRDALRARTDECQELFDRFSITACREDFAQLVAAWTRMLIAMDRAGPWVGGAPTVGGRLPVGREANPAPLAMAV